MTHSRIEAYSKIANVTEKKALSLENYMTAIARLKQTRLVYEQLLQRKERFDLFAHYRIAIFGSARVAKDSAEFQFVSALSQALIQARQIGVVTGGGPGIMQAANEGLEKAREARAKNGEETYADNIGVLISLPFEENGNGLTHITTKHENFSTRLQAFVSQIKAAYCAQGGIGTALEMLYLLQLKQVHHLESDFPILAHPMWEGLFEVLDKCLYHDRTKSGDVPLVSEKDLHLVQFTDDREHIVQTISEHYDNWEKNIRSKINFVYNPQTIKDDFFQEVIESVGAKPRD